MPSRHLALVILMAVLFKLLGISFLEYAPLLLP